MWRQHWFDSGMPLPWSHQLIPAPSGWDPVGQLAAQIATEVREAFEHRPAHPRRDIPAPSTFPPYPTGPPKPSWETAHARPSPNAPEAERNPITEYDDAAWEGPPGPDVDNDDAGAFYRDCLATSTITIDKPSVRRLPSSLQRCPMRSHAADPPRGSRCHRHDHRGRHRRRRAPTTHGAYRRR